MYRVNSLIKSRSLLAQLTLVSLIVNVSLSLSYSSSSGQQQQDYSGNGGTDIEVEPMAQCQTQTDQADLKQQDSFDKRGGLWADSMINKQQGQKSDEAYQIIDNDCIEQQQEQPLNKKLRDNSKYEYPIKSYSDGGEDNWQQTEDTETSSEKGMVVQKEMKTTQTADEPDDYQIIKTNQGGKTHSEVTEKETTSFTMGNDNQQQKEQVPEQEPEIMPEQKKQQQLQEEEPIKANVDQQQQEEVQSDIAEQGPEKAADPMLTSKRWQSSTSESNGASRTPKYLGFGQVEKNKPVNGRTQARLSCQFGGSPFNTNREDILNVEWAKFVGDYDPNQQDTPSFDCQSSSCSVDKIRTDVRTTINQRPKMKKSPTTNRMMPSYSMTLHEVGNSQVGVYRCSALRKSRGKKSELVYRIIQLD